ncbi:hypothetical protein AAVH_17405, partial [Aphelenchoides avenae]
MLPVETFSDVVSFFGYYDLGGLKLANKMFSTVAKQCAETIRVFDFSDFTYYMYDGWVSVYQLDAYGDDGPWVCMLQFENEESFAEFVSEAFRNCTVGRFEFRTRLQLVLQAIKAVASTVHINILDVAVGQFQNAQELLALVDSFRR